MTDIQYVQLDSSDFLTDIDFQMMDAEQRGVYCSIILYLYCNEGRIELNDGEGITLLDSGTLKLAQMSGCLKTGIPWDILWAKIAHKFQITGNILTHKRVTEELKRVEDFRKAKSQAGKKGMAIRWGDNTDITKVSKGKLSKGKLSKTKRVFTPPTLEEVQEYIHQNNYDVDAQTFIWHYSKLGWKNANGKPVKNWKQTLIQVWVKDERETTTNSQRQGAPPSVGRQGQAARRDTSESSSIGSSVEA